MDINNKSNKYSEILNNNNNNYNINNNFRNIIICCNSYNNNSNNNSNNNNNNLNINNKNNKNNNNINSYETQTKTDLETSQQHLKIERVQSCIETKRRNRKAQEFPAYLVDKLYYGCCNENIEFNYIDVKKDKTIQFYRFKCNAYKNDSVQSNKGIICGYQCKLASSMRDHIRIHHYIQLKEIRDINHQENNQEKNNISLEREQLLKENDLVVCEHLGCGEVVKKYHYSRHYLNFNIHHVNQIDEEEQCKKCKIANFQTMKLKLRYQKKKIEKNEFPKVINK